MSQISLPSRKLASIISQIEPEIDIFNSSEFASSYITITDAAVFQGVSVLIAPRGNIIVINSSGHAFNICSRCLRYALGGICSHGRFHDSA